MKLMRRGNVLYVWSKDLSHAEVSIVAVINRFKKDGKKERAHIVLDVREESATLITLLVLSRAKNKIV